MKVFRKMFAFAVTVAAIAMATSAFAATAEYDATNIKVKVADADALANPAQMTVAVVPTNFDGDDADIMYIDQDTSATIKANLKAGLAIKAALEVPTNYEVRVAGTDMDIDKIKFNSIQVVDDVTKVPESTAAAIGFTGTFQYNGGANKTIVLNFSDSKTGATNVPYTWDLSEALPGAVAAEIVFGLEIQADNNQDLSGITVSFAN